MGDTCASKSTSASNIGESNCRDVTNTTIGIHGEAVQSTKTFDITGTWCDKHSEEYLDSTITDVMYNESGNMNLFSIPHAMEKGWILHVDKSDGLKLSLGVKTIKFDIKIETQGSALYCGYFKRDHEVRAISSGSGTKITVGKAHDLLGHCNEETTRTTAKMLGW